MRTIDARRGRPRTKINKEKKVLVPKFKIRLNDKTIVYVRSLKIMEEIWRPLYPDLEVIK